MPPLEFAWLDSQHLAEICRIDRASFSHPWTESAYRHELKENPLAHYLGCFCGEELAGFAGFWLVVDEAQISNVAISPDFRQRGFGRQLMEQVIAHCLALGGRSISLEVRAGNVPAIALYQGLGFQTVGRRRGYYTQPDEDALLMELRLPELEESGR